MPSLPSLFSYSDILVIEFKDSNLLLFNTCTTIGKESCLDLQGIRINEM